MTSRVLKSAFLIYILLCYNYIIIILIAILANIQILTMNTSNTISKFIIYLRLYSFSL